MIGIGNIEGKKKHSFIEKFICLAAAISVARIFPEIGWWFADWGAASVEYPKFGFAWDMVHHAVQMLLAVFVIALPFWKKSFSDWGFNNENSELNRKIILRFLIGFVVFFTIGKSLYLWFLGWPPALEYNQDTTTVWKLLIFRMTMPGVSEEILFRALVMGILMKGWKESISLHRIKISYSGLLSAVIFAIAHVGFTIVPFELLYCVPGQVAFAFIFGLFYSILYEKTGSILAPIVTHNIIDGVGTAIDWILTLIAA